MKEEFEIRLRCLELAYKGVCAEKTTAKMEGGWITLDARVFDRAEHMASFVMLQEKEQQEFLDKTIWDCEFTVRAYNCLISEKILTLGDLIRCSERDLSKIPNFGKKSLIEIRQYLLSCGLSLKPN